MPKYVEVTLENLYDTTHPVNLVGDASELGGIVTRSRWNQTATVRVTDHPADVSEEDPALFTNTYSLNVWRLAKAKLGTATVRWDVSGVDIVVPGTAIFTPIPKLSTVPSLSLVTNGTTVQVVSWGLVANAQQYRLQRQRVGIEGDYVTYGAYDHPTSEATSSGLSADQVVRYRVRAEATGYTSGDWVLLSTVTQMAPVDTEVPVPRNLTLTNTGQQAMSVAWTYGATEPEPDTFDFEYLRQGTDPTWTGRVTVPGSYRGGAVSFDIEDNQLVQVRVRATLDGVDSAWASASQTSLPAAGAPEVPAWLQDTGTVTYDVTELPVVLTFDSNWIDTPSAITAARINPTAENLNVTFTSSSVSVEILANSNVGTTAVSVFASNANGESQASSALNVIVTQETDVTDPNPPVEGEEPQWSSAFTSESPGAPLGDPIWYPDTSRWEYKQSTLTEDGDISVGVIETDTYAATLSNDPLPYDHYIQGRIDSPLVGVGKASGFIIRYNPATNTFYQGIFGEDFVAIQISDAEGNLNILQQTAPGSYIPTRGDIFTVRTVNDVMSIRVNDTVLLSVTDRQYQNTDPRVGLIGYCDNEQGWFSALAYGLATYEQTGNTPTALPQAVTISDVTESSMRLNWQYDTSQTEVTFDVQKLEQGVDVGWTTIGNNLPSTALFLDVEGLMDDANVSLRINATSPTGGTTDWVETSATTNPDTGTLNDVSNFAITGPTTSSLLLTWNYTGTNNTGFTIQYDNNGTWTDYNSNVPAATRQLTITGVEPDTIFYLRIAAFDANGQSAWAYAEGQTLQESTTVPVFRGISPIRIAIPNEPPYYQLDMNTTLTATNGTIQSWSVNQVTGVSIVETGAGMGVLTIAMQTGSTTLTVSATNENGTGSTNQISVSLYEAGGQTDLLSLTYFYNFEHMNAGESLDLGGNNPRSDFSACDNFYARDSVPNATPSIGPEGTRCGQSTLDEDDPPEGPDDAVPPGLITGYGDWGWVLEGSTADPWRVLAGGRTWCRVAIFWPADTDLRVTTTGGRMKGIRMFKENRIVETGFEYGNPPRPIPKDSWFNEGANETMFTENRSDSSGTRYTDKITSVPERVIPWIDVGYSDLTTATDWFQSRSYPLGEWFFLETMCVQNQDPNKGEQHAWINGEYLGGVIGWTMPSRAPWDDPDLCRQAHIMFTTYMNGGILRNKLLPRYPNDRTAMTFYCDQIAVAAQGVLYDGTEVNDEQYMEVDAVSGLPFIGLATNYDTIR